MTKRTLAIAIAAALAATAISGGAHAATDTEHRAKAVTYGDLNLASSEDGRILHRRIVSAARQICAEPRIWTVTVGADYSECFRHAVQNAVNRVGERSLMEAHLDRFAWAAEPAPALQAAYRR